MHSGWVIANLQFRHPFPMALDDSGPRGRIGVQPLSQQRFEDEFHAAEMIVAFGLKFRPKPRVEAIGVLHRWWFVNLRR
jgi:hypothetical protein